MYAQNSCITTQNIFFIFFLFNLFYSPESKRSIDGLEASLYRQLANTRVRRAAYARDGGGSPKGELSYVIEFVILILNFLLLMKNASKVGEQMAVAFN